MKLRIMFRVSDCLNTIFYMQNEKDYLNHYNEFLHILDFEKFFEKIVYALLVKETLNLNIYLFLIDLNKFLLFVYV